MEKVNHPIHYKNTENPYIIVNGSKIYIECIDVIRDMPSWKGNVFKYLWRAGKKSEEGYSVSEKELEDMYKALWYLQDKIKDIETSLNISTTNA